MEESENQFYIIRTVPGKEEKYLDTISTYLKKVENHGIYSIFKPELIKGYLFAECEGLHKLKDSLRGLPNNRGIIATPIEEEEIEKYFLKNEALFEVNEKDLVEVIAGPFKGYKARVIRIINGKDEIVIEPIDMQPSIPISLNLEDIRVLKEED